MLPCILHSPAPILGSFRTPFPVFSIRSTLPPLILAKDIVYSDSTLPTAEIKQSFQCANYCLLPESLEALPSLCGVTTMSHYFIAMGFASSALFLAVLK